MKRKTDSSATVREVALRLLARRDHGVHELRQKLLARRFQMNEIHAVLQQLEEQNWLSEQRFVKNFIEYRRERKFGPLKIQADLQARGVSKDLIDALLWADTLDWSDLLIDLCNKKFTDGFSTHTQERAKQIQFLQRRGFTLDQITKLIKFKSDMI